jgi:hypothetical protein
MIMGNEPNLKYYTHQKSGLTYNVESLEDWDINSDHTLRYSTYIVREGESIVADEPTVCLDITFEYDESSVDVEWSKYEPNMVPYGDTYVREDNGGYEIISIDTRGAVSLAYMRDAKIDFIDMTEYRNSREVSKEQAAEVLGCTVEDIDEIIVEIKKLLVPIATIDLEELYEEYAEYDDSLDESSDQCAAKEDKVIDWRDVEWD